MSALNFNLVISITDPKQDKGILFSGKRVELWRKENSYSEFIADALTDDKSMVSFSFQLQPQAGPDIPLIGIKIFNGASVIEYFFRETNNQTSALMAGDNNLTAIVSLPVQPVPTNNNSGNSEKWLTGVLLDTNGNPYPAITVTGDIFFRGKNVAPLRSGITNPLGFFTFGLVFTPQLEAYFVEDPKEAVLIFQFQDQDGNFLGKHKLPVEQINKNVSPIIFEVQLNISLAPKSIAIQDLINQLGFSISDILTKYLEINGIVTLRDIRAVGGLSRLMDGGAPSDQPGLTNEAIRFATDAPASAFAASEVRAARIAVPRDAVKARKKVAVELVLELQKSEMPTIQRLDAHAQLETVSADYSINDHIYFSGYSTVYQISKVPRTTFVQSTLKDGIINEFQATLAHRVASANSRLYSTVFTERWVSSNYITGENNINNILSLINDDCNCSDCDAAVSPTAYLADLIWYATRYLQITVSPDSLMDYKTGVIDVKSLQSLFCRDFCLSSDDCDDITNVLCVYRVQIEVLNCYREWVGDQSLCQTLNFATAQANYLVTAYYTLLEQLGTTYFEVRAVANSNDAKQKRALAQKLGLIASYQDGGNTIYTTDVIYLDPNAVSGSKVITNANLESIFGLRDYTQDCLYVQPKSLIQTWKEEYQQQAWLQQDSDHDIYSLSTPQDARPLPIIDPDLIGLDDLRHPDPVNSSDANAIPIPVDIRPAALWLTRRLFLDNIWNNLFYNKEGLLGVSLWTPTGVTQAYSQISVNDPDGTIAQQLSYCSKLRVLNSPGNEGVYTIVQVESGVGIAVINLAEQLTPPLDQSATIEYLLNLVVTGYSGNVINAVGDLSGIAVGSFIELRDSTNNNGIYQVQSVSNQQITVDRSLSSYAISNTTVFWGTGLKTFSVAAGLSFAPGQPVKAAYGNDVMTGVVNSYSGTSLVINVNASTQNSSSATIWNIDPVGGTLLGMATNAGNIATGPQNFTIASGLPFWIGQTVVAAIDGGNWMVGNVTAYVPLANNYTSSTLSVNVSQVFGSGTPQNSWWIAPLNDKVVTSRTLAGLPVASSAVFNNAVRINGPLAGTVFVATSADTVAWGTGAKNFTLSNSLSLAAGQPIMISSGTGVMTGVVSSCNGTSLAVSVNTSTTGTGTSSSWTIQVLGGNYLAASGSVNSIAVGSKTFSVGSGLPFWVGQIIVMAFDGGNWMVGNVTAYSGTQLDVYVMSSTGGNSSFSSWWIASFTTDIAANIDSAKPLVISNSSVNDGTYTINKAKTSTYTEISLFETLPGNIEDGSVTYSSINITGSTDLIPNLGNRKLFFKTANLNQAVNPGDVLQLVRQAGTPASGTYNVAAVTTSGAYTVVQVKEPLFGNEVGARVSKSYPVIMAANTFAIPNDLALLYGDLRNNELNKVTISGTDYKITLVQANTPGLGQTTFTISSAQPIPDGANTVSLFFVVKQEDTAGKGFTMDNLPSEVVAGDTFVLNAGALNLNTGTYSIKNITAVTASTSFYEVNEVVLDPAQIPHLTATVYFKKTVPIIYSRPNLDAIFNILAGSSAISPLNSVFQPSPVIFQYYPYPENTTAPVGFQYNPWSFSAINLGNLISTANTLQSATDSTVINTLTDLVWQSFKLDPDSFAFLAQLYTSYKQQLANVNSPRLTTNDYQQLFNILLQSVKNNYAPWWVAEERDVQVPGYKPVQLSYAGFWPSLTEPATGNMQVEKDYHTPVIDPQLMGLNNLPDFTVGYISINIYNARVAQLANINKAIEQTLYNYGFAKTLQFGLGGINSTDDFSGDLNDLLAQLNSIDIDASNAAAQQIQNELLISADDFKTIMLLQAQLGTNVQPGNDQYQQLYAVLTTAYKKRVLYPAWLVEESQFIKTAGNIINVAGYANNYTTNNSATNFYNYWLVQKASLPKWRSSASSRQVWQSALVSRQRQPIVEPDLLYIDDFIDYTGRAYGLWSSRSHQVANIYSRVLNTLASAFAQNNTGTAPTPLGIAVSELLGITGTQTAGLGYYGFETLGAMDAAGIDIRPRLAQLNLTYQSYSRLTVLLNVGLTSGWSELLPTEVTELVNILVQAWKFRVLYAQWNDVESDLPAQLNAISLSPYIFKITPAPYDAGSIAFYQDLPLWRSTWKERQTWVSKLQSRTDDYNNLQQLCKNIISNTENQVLPIIRDALVMYDGQEEASLYDNAKALSSRLLMDFAINCCQDTTRIAVAIDTLQKLLWGTSCGLQPVIQLNKNTNLQFSILDDNFEAQWQWLGSYATWRAAMFVFMYPENLLLPTLRTYQSPGFSNLTDAVQNSNQLTASNVCELAQGYSKYFDDIANLEPEASCNANVAVNRDACVNNTITSPIDPVFFAFATAKKSQTAYWHRKRTNGNTEADYTFWQAIDGLGTNVTGIVGASVYQPEADIRHIYLFATVHEDQTDKLVYIKYDLNAQSWDSSSNDLSMPDDVDFTTIKVLQSQNEFLAPELLYIGSKYNAVFRNNLNIKGKDWANDTWELISTAGNNNTYAKSINAYFILGNNGAVGSNTESAIRASRFDRVLVATNSNGQISYLVIGPNGDWVWRPVLGSNSAAVKFLGAVNFGLFFRQFIVMYQQSDLTCHQVSIQPAVMDANSFIPLSNFVEFDAWMVSTCGYGLSDFQLSNVHTELYNQFQKHWEFRVGSPTVQLPDNVLGVPSSASYPNSTIKSDYELYHQAMKPALLQNFKEYSIKSLFQAFQCMWDHGFTVPGGSWDNLTRITKTYSDTRGEMNSINNWLTQTYLQSPTENRARDISWLDALLTGGTATDGQQFPVWEHFYYDNIVPVNSAPSPYPYETTNAPAPVNLNLLINALLNWTAYDQWVNTPNGQGAGKNNDGTGGSFHNKYQYAYWKPVIMVLQRGHDIITSDLNDSEAPRLASFDFLRPWAAEHDMGVQTVVAKQYNGIAGNFAMAGGLIYDGNNNLWFNPQIQYRISPVIPGYTSITEEMSSSQLTLKQQFICACNQTNSNWYDPVINREYLREAWYFVPVYLGIQLSQLGYYPDALKWFKTVYDYTQSGESGRIIYSGLGLDSGSSSPDWAPNLATWLLDPLDPHALALGRANCYYKYTVYTIAQTFAGFADSQFAIDTSESVSEADTLYNFALSLLNLKIFTLLPDACNSVLQQLQQSTTCSLNSNKVPFLGEYQSAINSIYAKLGSKTQQIGALKLQGDQVFNLLVADAGGDKFNMSTNIRSAAKYVNAIETPKPVNTVQNAINNTDQNQSDIHAAVMSLPEVELAANTIAQKTAKDFTGAITMITARSTDDLNDKSQTISWLSAGRQNYKFDYAAEDHQKLMTSRNMSFSSPTILSGFTLVSNMNPIDALNILDQYPFPYVPIMGQNYCVPFNPVYSWLEQSTQLSLFKIRNCMNTAGMKRDLSPYSAPTDTTSGLPSIGGNGQLVLPGLGSITPGIYAYKTLIARAQQIATLAQQMETAYLQALVSYDSEAYNLMKAKQDLALSQANVTLADLQVNTASDQVDLATLQMNKAQVQVEALAGMINAGLNQYEQQMYGAYQQVANIQIALAVINTTSAALSGFENIFSNLTAGTSDSIGAPAAFALAVIQGALGVTSAGLQGQQAVIQSNISQYGILDAQARRVQDWNYQKTLATQDVKIGQQQIKIAQDGLRVAGQQDKIANLQQQNASDSVNFLTNKFTNAELYHWMSGVLQQVYSYFLHTATGVAKLAQSQLAFERQVPSPGYIQSDYWVTPTDNNAQKTANTGAPDRRGLTGSSRLLEDIEKLDEYAFETDRFKLQMSKTFSLQNYFPYEFQQFLQTGEITFITQMSDFDQDYPGHYLRMIKKVTVDVIALAPPAQGIKATLTSSGISHVVIGGNTFQDVIIKRSPERITLSTGRSDSGVFSLQSQDSAILNPFENTGVHTMWNFKMPMASNQLNFNTIADVLVTYQYTALYDSGYEQQVIKSLGTDFESDRTFSFKNDFPDAFYQWNNPDQFGNSTRVSIDTDKFDFPANVSGLIMTGLKFYFIGDQSDPGLYPFANNSDMGLSVSFNNGPVAGPCAINNTGVSSSQTNAPDLGTFSVPTGNWQITLTGLKDAFTSGRILDVIMIITYTGNLPART